MRRAERRTGSKRRSTRLRKQRSAVDATERTEKINGNERIRRTEVTPPRAEPYEDEVEVAVVGAGPVGLTAAAMLAAYGIRTVVLHGVTLVGNDWGGAQLLVSEGIDGRVGRLALASCEAFDNYPPGVPGRAQAQAARIPGGICAAFQSLRLRPLRRLPMTWGWMSKRPVPHEVMDEWFRPLLTNPEIRRDLREYVCSIPRGWCQRWRQKATPKGPCSPS